MSGLTNVLDGMPIEQPYRAGWWPSSRWNDSVRAIGRAHGEELRTVFDPSFEHRPPVRDSEGKRIRGCWLVVWKRPVRSLRESPTGIMFKDTVMMWRVLWAARHPHEKYPFDLQDSGQDISDALRFFKELTAWRGSETAEKDAMLMEQAVALEQKRLERLSDEAQMRYRDLAGKGISESQDLNGSIQDDASLKRVEEAAELSGEIRAARARHIVDPSIKNLTALQDLQTRARALTQVGADAAP